MEQLRLPRELAALVENKPCSTDRIGMSGSTVLIYEEMVLKIRPETVEARLEHEMLEWLAGRLPVPRCLYHQVLEGKDYLLTSRAEGEMACTDRFLDDPVTLADTLADGLRLLWQTDISHCPSHRTLATVLADAEHMVSAGLTDTENTDPATFGPGGFRNPEHLLSWLQNNRPEEDTVLSHGDFCLPNIFLKNGAVSCFIDLGRCGVADRWQDIALCWRSFRDNYNGCYSGKVRSGFDPAYLFDALDISRDTEKLRYYLLLDELF